MLHRVYRPTREFLTHMETSPLRWRAANFDLCSALMAIEQWGFFSARHLLRHGSTLYIPWKQIVHVGLYFIRLDRQRTKNSQTLSLSLCLSLSPWKNYRTRTGYIIYIYPSNAFWRSYHFNAWRVILTSKVILHSSFSVTGLKAGGNQVQYFCNNSIPK